jgi:uncharacterized RDD family membrane protein YckC
MNCPTCGSALAPGLGRCASCGESVAPPVEGALAADPRRVTPPSRGRAADTLREIPGLRRRESTWKDEVRERVRNRREQRSASPESPLVPAADPKESGEATSAPAPMRFPSFDASLDPPFDSRHSGSGGPGPAELGEEADLLLRPESDLELRDNEGGSRALFDDAEPPIDHGPPTFERAPVSLPRERTDHEVWSVPETPEAPDTSVPLERPATLGERFQAGALDAALLVALWAVVVYFASRAARVSVTGLLPAWPSLAAYLAFLGLAYAGYFTGTTGQTLGKIVLGLRVVDSRGQPPGYFRAFLRAVVGVVSGLAAALGFATALFDPLRRTLHDRLLGTRVVKN